MFQYFSTILYVHFGNSREEVNLRGGKSLCSPPSKLILALACPSCVYVCNQLVKQKALVIRENRCGYEANGKVTSMRWHLRVLLPVHV